jgi:hypothetical protein
MASTNGNEQARHRRGGFLHRYGQFVEFINQKFAYFVGLPTVTLIGTFLAAHFQYVSAYEDKVRAAAEAQLIAADSIFTDASTTFSKAITLQQIIYFNFRDVSKDHRLAEAQTMEAKTARGIYPQYVEARTNLRETVDLLARRVELGIDWASDTGRNAAHAGEYGADPLTRIALGEYNFDCDKTANMPAFIGITNYGLKARDDSGQLNPSLPDITIDRYSAKLELLTMFYCFDVNNERIKAAREWAAVTASTEPKLTDKQIRESLDREAIRLHSFLTLAARRIEKIRVKFRPVAWYCHFPVARQVIDAYTKKCSPIYIAQNGASS